MESMDLDGNGSIDYNEFITATINKSKVLSKQNLEAAFNAFDKVSYIIFLKKDGSGKISVEEIMGLFNQTSSTEEKKNFEKMILEFDVNGDGEISLDEFKKLMSKLFWIFIGIFLKILNCLMIFKNILFYLFLCWSEI